MCAFSSLGESVKIFHLKNGQSDGLTPSSCHFFPWVNGKTILDRRQIEFKLWWEIQGNAIFQNSTWEALEFLSQHTNTLPPSEVEKAEVKIWKGVVCKNQPKPLILNSPFTSAHTSHFRRERMKRAKDPAFQSCRVGLQSTFFNATYFFTELCAFVSECDLVCQHKPL